VISKQPNASPLAVIAIGGNSLIKDAQHPEIRHQWDAVRETASLVANMIQAGWRAVITHGNGPQVGYILRRNELAIPRVHTTPMDLIVADTQGSIGYMLQQALSNEFYQRSLTLRCVTTITQMLVDRDDPAFSHPTKPIGGFLDEERARRFEASGWPVVEDAGRGWRRVVASPEPLKIIEEAAITEAVTAGWVVIAVGGGGIPVIRNRAGELRGVTAVIDKDLASGLLATRINADLFLISTGVERVALNFYKPTPERGQFHIEPGKYYHGKIAMTDSYGNTSNVQFVIYGNESGNASGNEVFSQSITSNKLKIVGDTTSGQTAIVTVKDELTMLESVYTNKKGYPVFIWDLTKSIPDAIGLADTTIYPKIVSMVPPRHEYKVFNSHADVLFNKNSLFDTLMFSLDYQIDTSSNLEKIYIGNPDIPIKGSVKAILKPKDINYNTKHTAVYQVHGKNKLVFTGGKWKENQIEFNMRSFGVYTIVEDSIPPMVKPLIVNNRRLVFTIDDKLSGIKDIKASIDGKWLLIAKNPKKKQYWAEKQFPEDSYSGNFQLEVTDNANNTKLYTSKIK
jgi:carbamate kinase